MHVCFTLTSSSQSAGINPDSLVIPPTRNPSQTQLVTLSPVFSRFPWFSPSFIRSRSRGYHGSQSRRQPWQPHDSHHSLLLEEPQDDCVLPGLWQQAVPAPRHLPSKWNMWQTSQQVRNTRSFLRKSTGDVAEFWFILNFFFFFLYRYMELVHTDSNFKPEESFFQLFSDPLSTRLTRVQLKEDFVCDRDLEAIRKQVRFSLRERIRAAQTTVAWMVRLSLAKKYPYIPVHT